MKSRERKRDHEIKYNKARECVNEWVRRWVSEWVSARTRKWVLQLCLRASISASPRHSLTFRPPPWPSVGRVRRLVLSPPRCTSVTRRPQSWRAWSRLEGLANYLLEWLADWLAHWLVLAGYVLNDYDRGWWSLGQKSLTLSLFTSHCFQRSGKEINLVRVNAFFFFYVHGRKERSDYPQGHKTVSRNAYQSYESLGKYIFLGDEMMIWNVECLNGCMFKDWQTDRLTENAGLADWLADCYETVWLYTAKIRPLT